MRLEIQWTENFVLNINLDFMQKMANRMMQAIGKYEPAIPNKEVADRGNHVKSARDRIDLYEKTGNTEWLVDAANSCMIEFTHPQHPNAHFRSTSSGESPGIIGQDGERIRGHHEHSERRPLRKMRWEGD